jgi:hypothetical protein
LTDAERERDLPPPLDDFSELDPFGCESFARFFSPNAD